MGAVSHKLKRDNGDQYNFGVDRLDVFVSLVCDLLMLTGFVGLTVYAVYGFLHPEEPSDNLNLFLILKVLNIAFDVFFVFLLLAIRRKTRSKINETELTACVSCLADDTESED